MEIETTYWLQIGDGQYQYTTEVSKEAFMAMERECGFYGEPNELATCGFTVPAIGSHLRVKGWTAIMPVIMPPEVSSD